MRYRLNARAIRIILHEAGFDKKAHLMDLNVRKIGIIQLSEEWEFTVVNLHLSAVKWLNKKLDDKKTKWGPGGQTTFEEIKPYQP